MNTVPSDPRETAPIATQTTGLENRVGSIDAYRGLVMLLMLSEALDVPDGSLCLLALRRVRIQWAALALILVREYPERL